MRYLCEQFAKRDPQLTREQVRSHYYQLLNTPVEDRENFKKGPWTPEEDDFLFAAIEEKSKEMNKLEIFEYVGMKLNRNPRAVASHYYNMEKIRKQNEDEELDKFIVNKQEDSHLFRREMNCEHSLLIKVFPEQYKLRGIMGV